MNKKAILLVTTGTSKKEALNLTIEKLALEIKEKFPAYVFYLAISSVHIRNKMQMLCEDKILDIEGAFSQMKVDGIQEVYIQSTFLLSGLENEKLHDVITRYKKQFQIINVGAPLLAEKKDYIKTLQVLLEDTQLHEEEALILVGHGTTHVANTTYQNLEYTAYTNGYRNIFVATIGNIQSGRMLIRKLNAMGYKRVCLLPLLFVSGYHAQKDIDGKENSWKCFLQEAGYEVRTVMKGLGEYPGIRAIFMEHLEAYM